MAEQKTDSPAVPLPDPEKLQRNVAAAMTQLREKRGLYIGLGLAALALVVGLLIWLNWRGTPEAPAFEPMWSRAEKALGKLTTNESAGAEIADLEAYVSGQDDAHLVGIGKWILAILHYREAYTAGNLDFADKKPHLEKALAHAENLQSNSKEYDKLPVVIKGWFTEPGVSPVKQLRDRIKADLDFEEANRIEQPAPDDGLTAVLRTSDGDIYLRFFRKLAPLHVDNFVSLSAAGAYNGTAFHFVGGGNKNPLAVHGGDPYSFFYNDPRNRSHILRWGQGGLGYHVPPEQARYMVGHRERIVSSMRASGRAQTADWDNAAMFQILLQADPGLDRVHTPFAQVVEGFDIVTEAAGRATAAEDQTYKDATEFSSSATRDLIVKPVIIHKVVIFGQDGKAVEHAFPLADNEKSLGTVKNAPVQPLEGDALYAGRKLVNPLTADPETIRRGLDTPFPIDVVPGEANPLGDREGVRKTKGDNGTSGAGDRTSDDSNKDEKSPDSDAPKDADKTEDSAKAPEKTKDPEESGDKPKGDDG